MLRPILPLLLLIAWAGTGYSQNATTRPPVFVIRRPTIVAFFPPVTRSDLEASDDTNEALSDFEFYVGTAKPPLQKAGIGLEEVYNRSFEIRLGSKTRTFRPRRDRAGYYFIAPGKHRHLVYDIMTDQDILDAAQGYFGIFIPRESCKGPHCPN